MDLQGRGDAGGECREAHTKAANIHGETLKKQSPSWVKAASAMEIVGEEIINFY